MFRRLVGQLPLPAFATVCKNMKIMNGSYAFSVNKEKELEKSLRKAVLWNYKDSFQVLIGINSMFLPHLSLKESLASSS